MSSPVKADWDTGSAFAPVDDVIVPPFCATALTCGAGFTPELFTCSQRIFFDATTAASKAS
jgi:hypothetical protein